MADIVLGRKQFAVPELVFRQLRIICRAYGVLGLSSATDADKVIALNQLLLALVGRNVNLAWVSKAEWEALFAAIPQLCGLDNAATDGEASADNWGAVYAHLSACFGWDYDYIDNHMTLARLKEYGDYLRANPPTHQMVAAYLGVSSKEDNSNDAIILAAIQKAKLKQQQAQAGMIDG